MPLTQAEITALRAFEGYGRRDAPVWFLGMEEAADDPELLHVRGAWAPTRDLRDAHVDDLEIPWHHPQDVTAAVLQPTWRPMCTLMVQAAQAVPYDRAVPKERRALDAAQREYQVNHLGRTKGETFLCELLPVPKPLANKWDFETWFPEWPTYLAYKNAVLRDRVELLRGLVEAHPPEVVVAYGKAFWPSYAQVFPGTEFTRANEDQATILGLWSSEHALPVAHPLDASLGSLLIGLHRGRTLVLLVHHLTRENRYDRLTQLASLIRSHRQQRLTGDHAAAA